MVCHNLQISSSILPYVFCHFLLQAQFYSHLVHRLTTLTPAVLSSELAVLASFHPTQVNHWAVNEANKKQKKNKTNTNENWKKGANEYTNSASRQKKYKEETPNPDLGCDVNTSAPLYISKRNLVVDNTLDYNYCHYYYYYYYHFVFIRKIDQLTVDLSIFIPTVTILST